jgi:hypothetical protein
VKISAKRVTRITLACICVVALLLFRELLVPTDWVRVHLEQVPPDASHLYLVAKTRGEIRPLRWYLFKGLAFADDPKVGGEHWNETLTNGEGKGDIQWVRADSLGVLARLKSGQWVLWWLKPENVRGPTFMRYILGGGEEVTIQALGFESSEIAPKTLLDQIDTGGP